MQYTKKALSFSILIVGALGLLILGNNIVKAITEGGAGNTNEITIPQDLAVTRFIADSNSATGTVGQVLTAKAGGVEWSDASSGGQTLYDFTVCASGCDYTSIYTAFNSNSTTPSSYFIARGSYTETSNMAVPATSIVYFEDVEMNGDVKITISGEVKVSGKLELSGAGTSTAHNMIIYSGNYIDASDLVVKLNPSAINTTAEANLAFITADYSELGEIQAFDVTNVITTQQFRFASLDGANYNNIKIRERNLIVSGGTNYGILIANSTGVNLYANITGVDDRGISLYSATYTLIQGVTRGNGNNYDPLGTNTGTNVTSLIQ